MVIEHTQIIEALIFASDVPLSSKRIKEIVPEVGSEKQVKKIVQAIDERYEEQNRPYKIIELAGGYQMVTREEFATWISLLYQTKSRARLTRKGLETLAIVAYKQPVTKTEVEHIRGVNSDGVIRTLIERNLITVTGREKAPGTPLLYGTTSYFLETFGLADISHLPKLKEIDELIKGDSKFLESLDQVALDQMMPEALGLAGPQEQEAVEGEHDVKVQHSEQPVEEPLPNENNEEKKKENSEQADQAEAREDNDAPE